MIFLNGIISVYSQCGRVVIAGDFNASYMQNDVGRSNVLKSNELINFIETNRLFNPYTRFEAISNNPPFTFTGNNTMLDYILLDEAFTNHVRTFKIFNEGEISSTSDHLPVYIEISISENIHALSPIDKQLPAWHRASNEQVLAYENIVSS